VPPSRREFPLFFILVQIDSLDDGIQNTGSHIIRLRQRKKFSRLVCGAKRSALDSAGCLL
jgi:hypothetical protein